MKKLRILAVDDEKNVLYLIANTLQEYDVTEETSPLQAIELMQRHSFDIIITDYYMPTINGIELLEAANELHKNKRYVSILCTAYGTTYLFEHEQENGLFQLFLEKPFTRETLHKAITEAVILLEKVCAGVK